MSAIEFLAQPVWQRLTLTLLHFFWQGLIVAIGIVAIVRLLKLRHGPPRYAAYLAALIVMAACPVATFLAVQAPRSTRPNPAPAPAVTDQADRPHAEPALADRPAWIVQQEQMRPPAATVVGDQALAEAPATAEIAIEAAPTPTTRWRDVATRCLAAGLPWVTAAWVLGVSALSLRLLLGLAGVQRWRRRLEPLPHELQSTVAILAERMGLRDFGRVFVSKFVPQPLAVGCLRPLILLPAAMLAQMPPEMLEAVIAHELAHIRRLDLWVNLLQRLVETLLFYHPAVWWLSRRVRSERELCCDELAVAATGERLTYASALAHAYRASIPAALPAAGVALGADKLSTLTRVRHVLGLSGRDAAGGIRWLVGALVMLALVTAALVTYGSLASAQTRRSSPTTAQAPAETIPDDRSPVGRLDKPPAPPAPNADAAVDFDKVSVVMKAPLSFTQPQEITISADGTCVYKIEERPKRGEQRRWPAARLAHKIDQKRLGELQQLLADTKWLTAPGGAGPAVHTDAGEWTITVTRAGQTNSVVCNGQRPEPYRSLMWFFRGLAHPENLLYRLNHVPDHTARQDACRDIQSELEWHRGRSGNMAPLFDVDYDRYRETFARVLRRPFGHFDWELTTALELMAHLEDQSHRDDIIKLLRDRDMHVRDAAARAVVALNAREMIPILADVFASGGGDEAGWSLIRFGADAVPTIVEMIERGMAGDDITSGKLVRVYLEHWRELPGPLDQRIVAAVRKAIANSRDISWRNYYEAFLDLARTQPPAPGAVTCRINRSWSVLRDKPVRLIHGWYIVDGDKIVDHGAGPAPLTGTERFSLVRLDPKIVQGQLEIETGWLPARPSPGQWPVRAVAAVRQIDVPGGAELKRVYHAHDRVQQANDGSPVRITNQYATLWEGWLVHGDTPLKRLVYVARIADPDDPAQEFTVPQVPPAARGHLAQPRPPIDFRGIKLTRASKLADPAVLNDLAVALNNHAIRTQGGKPRDSSKAVVIYQSALKEGGGYHFVVFHDADGNVFYVQVKDTRSGVHLNEYHGPFDGDPAKILKLNGEPDEPTPAAAAGAEGTDPIPDGEEVATPPATPLDKQWEQLTGKSVHQLEAESMEDSLRMLAQVEPFFHSWTHDGSGGLILPRETSQERIDVEMIMSNRRFLKVFQELSQLPQEEAGRLIAREIQAALPAYEKMSEECWNVLSGKSKPDPADPPSFNQISNNPDGSPTLYGLRYKLLALVLIAGNLDLTNTQPAIKAVVTEACRQRDLAYDLAGAGESQFKAWHMVKDVALYNRTILATAIMGTAGGQASQPAQKIDGLSDKFESKRLTRYDAEAQSTMVGQQTSPRVKYT